MGINLPPQIAQQQQAQMSLNHLRITIAKDLHQMFLAKQIQPFRDDSEESWKSRESADGQDASQIAQRAVMHADALMTALGFRVEARPNA